MVKQYELEKYPLRFKIFVLGSTLSIVAMMLYGILS